MAPTTLIKPALFDQLKAKMDEDENIKKGLNDITKELEKEVSYTQGLLSRVHSTPRARYGADLLPQVEDAIKKEIEIIQKLSEYATKYPYYKHNYKWTRTVQEAISTVLLCAWLGGMRSSSRSSSSTAPRPGRLLELEELGVILSVPVNLKDRDAFHVTIEEYLLALIGVVEELSRLAINSVTLRDNEMAVLISGFVKHVHAGFQVLNLKNDILRKRVDSVKYAVKKIEDVVYDLSLRGLIPPAQVME